MALGSGDTLFNGHYRILHHLGRGGFGFVYLAQDTLLDEPVAIKELIPALVGDETMLKRFLAEAKATMRLTHKLIVRTYNVFHEGSNYYIVMEYMPGGSLEERLREQGALPVEEAIRIAAEVCEGLACAHEEGVVHCDLKPANILFAADGTAKVADFGIAHVSGEMLSRSWMTPAGFVAGTLPYMSPEQADGVRDDPRLDLYALGAVLYRMLTGRVYLEFDHRETPRAQMENVQRIYSQQPATPSAHNPRIPAWLDETILRALAKRPEARFAGAVEMRAALLREEGARPAPVADQAAPTPPIEVSAEEAPPPQAEAIEAEAVARDTDPPIRPGPEPPAAAPSAESYASEQAADAAWQPEDGFSDSAPIFGPLPEDAEGSPRPRGRRGWLWVLAAGVALPLALVLARVIVPSVFPASVPIASRPTETATAPAVGPSATEVSPGLATGMAPMLDMLPTELAGETLSILAGVMATDTPAPNTGTAGADRVVAYEPGPGALEKYQLPKEALGDPDLVEAPCCEGMVQLGREGELLLAFTDNPIVDGPGDDFQVYGESARDDYLLIEVSDDGQTWQEYPKVSESPGGLDLDDVGLDRAYYVRLTDVQPATSTGAEVDAVVALNSAPEPMRMGTVRGEIRWNDRPLAGMHVTLVFGGCFQAIVAETITDSSGEYRFEDVLAPAEYTIGLNGWRREEDQDPVFGVSCYSWPFELAAGKTASQDRDVSKLDLVLVKPTSGAVTGQTPTFEWKPYPGAASYTVELSKRQPSFANLFEKETTETSLLTPGILGADASYDGILTAYNENGTEIAHTWIPEFWVSRD
jgi:serine/threonine protein kinase